MKKKETRTTSQTSTAVAASAAARAAKKASAESSDERHRPRDDPQRNAHVVPVRTYDLSITYDKYYQVPRFWLAGFDEDRRPLGADALLEDVAAEHARKTVTMEPHPHLLSSTSPSGSSSSSSSIKVASIHPCRHAAVMKKLASMGAAGGGSGGSGGSSGNARATAEASGSAAAGSATGAAAEAAAGAATTALDPEAYLVLFLKFIASVIPTIEYDFTMHASVGGGR